ncbi:5-formyltetrahydrofolate cyclo-ligase [Planctomicrobium sp. SH664]|uniref:5-formyltetrahydrofolate cyclo-ligase n=1 Tax=Planctomicrobium sp. SH664 TaxID=3448125 RepID=UPI003F5B900F
MSPLERRQTGKQTIVTTKPEIRRQVRQLRAALPDREERTAQILQRLTESAYWNKAAVRLYYVGARDEVGTLPALEADLKQGRSVVVPYCRQNDLLLSRIVAASELSPGSFGIPEPLPGIQSNPTRNVAPQQIDAILIPGVAFDRQGNRLGYGRGYYDRLLQQLPPACLRIGLAFDVQLVEDVPVEPHDEPVHLLITENECIEVHSPSSPNFPGRKPGLP